MGFEQLAALRDQLAAQARQNKRADHSTEDRAQTPRRRRDAASKQAPATPADTAGSGNAPARPARARQPAGSPVTTAEPDKARRPRRRERPARETPVDPVLAAIAVLQRRFPKAFPRKPAPKVPLQLGIHQMLLAQADTLGLDETALHQAIGTWCAGLRYWGCLLEGADRVSLTGEPAGTVTAPEARRARQLAGRHRHQARQAARRTAQAEDGKANDRPSDALAETDNAASIASDVGNAEPATADKATQAASDAPVASTPATSPEVVDATPVTVTDVAGEATLSSTENAPTR